MPDHFNSAFLTDLYELTMAAAYFENNLRAHGTFELFVRSLPPQRGFLLAAGLERCLDFLEQLVFREEEIEYLRRQPVFHQISRAFFDYLKTLRFSGEVWAVPEGTAVFAGEPLLRVTAPIQISFFRDISSIQRHAIDQVQKIPAACTRLQNPEHYTVKFSQRLESLLRLVRRQITRESIHGGTLSA